MLDVGCGGGILAEAMAASGAQVTGIDLADKPLKVAMLHRMETGSTVDYRLVSAESIAEEAPGSFDVVTCMEMLEHVPQPASVVRACATLARPGGWVFFSTINRNPKSFLFAIVGAEHVLRLLPRGTHEYARFIRPSELARDCRDAGLAVADLTGMTYNPFTRSYALGRDVDVNYLVGMPQVIEAVLFDLDGTLADTAPDMALTVNRMRARRGLDPVAAELVRPHVSSGARGMIVAAFGIAPGDPQFPGLREEFLELYAENLCDGTRLFPGMAEVLDVLEAAGHRLGCGDQQVRALRAPRDRGTGARAQGGGRDRRRHQPAGEALSRSAPPRRRDDGRGAHAHALRGRRRARRAGGARRGHAGDRRGLRIPGRRNRRPRCGARTISWIRRTASRAGWAAASRQPSAPAPYLGLPPTTTRTTPATMAASPAHCGMFTSCFSFIESSSGPILAWCVSLV